MNKLSLVNNTDDNKHITFTISKGILSELKQILVSSENYNLKKKSIWINEAIMMLSQDPNYKEIIYNADQSTDDFVMDKINMTFQQRCSFALIRREVVKAYPDIEAPQSAIIRAAIFSRLFMKR